MVKFLRILCTQYEICDLKIRVQINLLNFLINVLSKNNRRNFIYNFPPFLVVMQVARPHLKRTESLMCYRSDTVPT